MINRDKNLDTFNPIYLLFGLIIAGFFMYHTLLAQNSNSEPINKDPVEETEIVNQPDTVKPVVNVNIESDVLTPERQSIFNYKEYVVANLMNNILNTAGAQRIRNLRLQGNYDQAESLKRVLSDQIYADYSQTVYGLCDANPQISNNDIEYCHFIYGQGWLQISLEISNL